MIRISALACASAAALALAACGGGSSENTGTSRAESRSGSRELKLELDDNYFEPKTVTGKPGATVKLELENEGKAEHTFTIDSQRIDKDLDAGKQATVSVKIPASGSVGFYCRYHKSAGMVGTLKASGATGGATAPGY